MEAIILLAIVFLGVVTISKTKAKNRRHRIEGQLLLDHQETVKVCCNQLMLFNNLVLVELGRYTGGDEVSETIKASLTMYLLEAAEAAHRFYQLPSELKRHIQFYQFNSLGYKPDQALGGVAAFNMESRLAPEIDPAFGMAAEAFDFFVHEGGEHSILKIKEVIKIWKASDSMTQ